MPPALRSTFDIGGYSHLISEIGTQKTVNRALVSRACLRLLRSESLAFCNRRRKRGDAGHVFGARTQIEFLPSAVDKRRRIDSRRKVERAYALGAVHLVRADRIEVDCAAGKRRRHFEKRLHSVAVEYATRTTPFDLGGDPFDVIERAGLVADVHHRHKYCIFVEKVIKFVLEHRSAFVALSDFERVSFRFERLCGVEHRGVFERRHDHRPLLTLQTAAQRDVVALAPRRREQQIRSVGRAQRGQYRLARGGDDVSVHPCRRIVCRRIEKFFHSVFSEVVETFGIHRRGRGIVQIDHFTPLTKARRQAQAYSR